MIVTIIYLFSRFSKDIGWVDKDLPLCMNDVLTVFMFLVSVIIITTFMNYWLLIPTIITGCLFYFLKNIYSKTSRSIKRLEGVSKYQRFLFLKELIK